MYYVYLLLLNNDNIYTGTTSDLQRRIREHKRGLVKYTRHKRPIRLIAYEAYLLKSDATRRERFLKTTEGKRLLKLQLKDCLEKFKGSSRHSTGRPIVPSFDGTPYRPVIRRDALSNDRASPSPAALRQAQGKPFDKDRAIYDENGNL